MDMSGMTDCGRCLRHGELSDLRRNVARLLVTAEAGGRKNTVPTGSIRPGLNAKGMPSGQEYIRLRFAPERSSRILILIPHRTTPRLSSVS